ncbi:hypothetical protein FRC09_014565, partial [Ceratobasidium sp. 395]
MHINSIHLRRLAEKAQWKARMGARRSQQPAAAASNKICAGLCLRTAWFLAGGIAVVCWTEKLGQKKHDVY